MIVLWDEWVDLHTEIARAKARKREFLNAGKPELADHESDEIARLKDQLWEIESMTGLRDYIADVSYARMG
jgi:uncharacterized protein YqeY